jgi:hypothetical protein
VVVQAGRAPGCRSSRSFSSGAGWSSISSSRPR